MASQALKELEITTVLPKDIQKQSKKLQLQYLLERNGLSLAEIVSSLRDISRGAEREETRLKANELALRLHDVLKDEKEQAAPQIVFQIAGENVSLGFLKPLGA